MLCYQSLHHNCAYSDLFLNYLVVYLLNFDHSVTFPSDLYLISAVKCLFSLHLL